MASVLHFCGNCSELIKECEHENDDEILECEAERRPLCSACREDPQRVLALAARLAAFGRS